MRFFHGLAGVGTSFGFPRVTALAKEGELACLALIRDQAPPSASELENWRRLLGALTHELDAAPAASPRPGRRSATATRLPEVLLIVDADEAVHRSLAPLLEQEGISSAGRCRSRAEAAGPSSERCPTACIVDAVAARRLGLRPHRAASAGCPAARPCPVLDAEPARAASSTRWRPSTAGPTATSRSPWTGRP